MTDKRTCHHCGQEKPYARGTWRWAARYGPYGNHCLSCYRDIDRERNNAGQARRRKVMSKSDNKLAKENMRLKKRLQQLLKEFQNEY